MQAPNTGSRRRLNRNAFKLEQGSVPKRRRLSRQSESQCTDPVDNLPTTRARPAPLNPICATSGPQGAHQEPTGYNQGTPDSDPSTPFNTEPSNIDYKASGRNRIRCQLHLALRFCGGEKSAEQGVSCTMSRYVETGPSGRSGADQGVSRSGVRPGKVRMGTPEKNDGPAARLTPNFKRKAGLRKHFGSISRHGSGREVKRCVKNPCCGLCGDVKYIPPARKKIAHAYKTRSSHPSQPRRLERTRVHPVARAKMTARLIIWFRRHLKVKLCDVGHVFDVTSRDFSCILPEVLLQKRKNKRVKCFSKEFRSLMRLDPQGSGNCGKWIGNQSWEVCSPTNSSASLSLGHQVLGFSVGERILDVAEDIEGWSESSGKQILRKPDCERMRLSSIEGTACDPQNPGEIQRCDETAARVHRVPPLLLRRVHACNGFTSSQKVQQVDLHDNMTVSEADPITRRLVENGMNESFEGNSDAPECFSCQRTTAYIARLRLSCARTYRSWPFPRHGPPSELKALIHVGPRWIVATQASEDTTNVINNMHIGSSTSFECMVGKNTKETLRGSEPHNGSVVPSTPLSERVQASPTVEEASKNQTEWKKNSGKSLTSISSKKEGIRHLRNVFPKDAASLGSGQENNPQALDIRSPEVITTGKLNVIAGVSISTVDTKSVGFDDFCVSGTQGSMSGKCLEDNEKGTEATADHLPGPRQDIQQSFSQTLSCIAHSREEPQPLTVTVYSGVEPKLPSSVLVHSTDEQKTDGNIENRVQSSLNDLHAKTADQNTPPLLQCIASTASLATSGSTGWDTPFKSVTNKDSFSLSEKEVSTLCSAKRPEEGDVGCSLQQDNMCEISQAKRSGCDLDVVRAYEDDAIVLDVIQDDPDLFGSINIGAAGASASKASPGVVQRVKMCMQRNRTTSVRKPNKIVWDLDSESLREKVQTDVPVENKDGFCRGEVCARAQCSRSRNCGTKWPLVNPIIRQEQMVPDCNNNLERKEMTDLNVNTVNTGSTRLMDYPRSNVYTTAGNDTNAVKSLPSSYCWYYFSGHHKCLRNVCWFLHVPRDNDEKFCMEVIQRFCHFGSPPIVERAVEVFVAYYRTNSPGVSFSQNIVNQLLSSLLSLVLLRDLVSVINTLLAHKRIPPPEFVMAVYEHVRDRGILNFVPELIHLTSKITEVGCVFSVEQCEMMQLHLESLHVPRQQMDIFCTVKCRALATNPHTAELSELAQAVVQVELCKQQEDWPALARVFCGVCRGHHSVGELSRFCCCVTMALLKEPKDKLTLPFEPFAESVCQEVTADEMVKSFLARVGVSLMFSYHRTQDWTRGVKLLCVMSRLQVEFTMLKGLFSSESGTSRCQLVTVATEFFLNSGSIEGALNMLKANEWFVSSCAWPCEQEDIQNRKRVLTLLAGRTSYRDTLEVLTNLPGLREIADGVEVGEYYTMFNAHLRRCISSQVLLVAADTLAFMLTQKIPADASELQNLIHKLGKQNSWSRARTLFKRAHAAGYYSGVVCEDDCLALPCCLTEIEMTLVVEMFIARISTSLGNPGDSSEPLLITLKRNTGNEVAKESVYLAAGCRLLSAALIPNPKLSIRYTAVSQEQEQLFKLERGSAAKWLSHNRSWAQGMWANSHTHTHTHTPHTDLNSV